MFNLLWTRGWCGLHAGRFFHGGGFFMILFWILLGAGVIWLLKNTVFNNEEKNQKTNFSRPQPVSSSDADNPLDIAKKRLARGEITKEEFAEIKQTLSENN